MWLPTSIQGSTPVSWLFGVNYRGVHEIGQMSKYKAPRGTFDVLPEEQKYWRYVRDKAEELAARYGYQRIDTPTFEEAGLFVRSVGQGTDIVEKETYTFEDRGGNELTLRPEGTAPVVRAYLEHGMYNLPQPVRLYYFCSVFRYERPQAGRYREHHQFGVEALGDGDPAIDAEVISLGWSLMARLGLRDLSLVINSIGDPACRPAYVQRLREYYADKVDRLCPDCRRRLERNPLRLLDCKEEGCQAVKVGAPRMLDYLCQPCREHWEALLRYLSHMGLAYRIDHRLVRGLDYYTRTVFEIQPPVEGGQSTILAGGRYDGLAQDIGGRPTPGIGFGTGIERLVLNLKRQEVPVPETTPRPVVVVSMADGASDAAFKLAHDLRSHGVPTLLAPRGKSARAQMRYAGAMDAQYVVILGEDELKEGTASVKDMGTGEQKRVPLAQVAQELPRVGTS